MFKLMDKKIITILAENLALTGHLPPLSFQQIHTSAAYCAVPFIMLCLGSTGIEHVILDLCYKETILQRNYRKIIIVWSFSCNFFEKIPFESHILYQNPRYNKVIPLYISNTEQSIYPGSIILWSRLPSEVFPMENYQILEDHLSLTKIQNTIFTCSLA